MGRRQDVRLARRIAAGDRDAAERWVRDQYPAVLRMLRHLLRGDDAACDLAQQAFIKALDGLPGYSGRGSLRAWLHTIAWHEYCRHCRTQRATLELSAAEASSNGRPGPDDLTAWLSWALARLTDEHRATFVLHEIQGLSVAEVAQVLEIPLGTVKSRLHTARARLRRMLGEPHEEHSHALVDR